MPRFCPICGVELQYQDAEICSGCGVRIKEPETRIQQGGVGPNITVVKSMRINKPSTHTPRETTYETNYILILLLLFGIISLSLIFSGITGPTAIIILISAVLVYFDARSIGEDKRGAMVASLGVLILWLIVLPIYLITRKGEYQKNIKIGKNIFEAPKDESLVCSRCGIDVTLQENFCRGCGTNLRVDE